jgi:hypothetical protein
MVNEALCKVLCHNVCCLIQSVYELGVVATFWDEPESANPAPIPAVGEIDPSEWDWI